MRHLLIAVAMIFGALVLTSVTSIALENRAAARVQPAAYEPPSLVASPAITYSKKSDSAVSGVQRARPRVIANPDQRA